MLLPLNILLPLLLLFPLLGIVINLVVGKRLGQLGPGIVASLATGAAFIVSVLLTLSLAANPEEAGAVFLADWFTVGRLHAAWEMRIDTLAAVMILVVTGVGTLIHVYAIGYMQRDVHHNEDPGRYTRFFVYFNLFILAMLVLVTANNYLMLFVGWEGVGLCSYLLIGFWFEKGEGGWANARAGKKAFIVNRIGDFGLLIALFLIFWNFGTFQFEGVFELAGAAAPGILLAITLLMLVGVTGKSAQLPLYVWLPDAMAGPTPVSALIHAATMVTAGVYLVARSSPLFLAVPEAQAAVMWVGALTALFAATIAVGQNDIKRVLAYSTISQLGFMVAAVGMGAFVAGMFHLVTHAFFKALLFLSAGSVIQGMERGHEAVHPGGHSARPTPDGHHPERAVEEAGHDALAIDPQDMRNMGGLQERMRTTFWVYLVGALALAGIAPLSGFFSKDEILAAAMQTSPVVWGILVAAAFLTAFYMGRQLFMVFFGRSRTDEAARASDSPAVVTVPLIILALLSFAGGALNLPGVLTLEHWLEHSLEQNFAAPFGWTVAGVALILALAGLFMAWRVYGRRLLPVTGPDPLVKTIGGLFKALENKWWVDELYAAVIVNPFRRLTQFFSTSVDLGGIDALFNGLANTFRELADMWRTWQTGYVRTYVLAILLGAVGIMAFLILR